MSATADLQPVADTGRGLGRERLQELTRMMARIRAFEERIAVEAADGRIFGPVHLSVGQEAVAAGVCANLERTDYLFSNHRGHGHALAKGADPEAMMKELFGRAGGTCGGKGGSMHVADFSVGMLGANGILADGATMAVGAAQAVELRAERRIVCVFIGDGTVNRGPFLESLNWATVFRLPVLFVIEDNLWASSTTTRSVLGGPGVAARATAFGVACDAVDGSDVEAVDAAAHAAVETVRRTRMPRMLHASAERLHGHIASDRQLYRSREAAADTLRDPLEVARERLLATGADSAIAEEIVRQEVAAIDYAVRAAIAAPFPDPREAYEHVQDIGGPEWRA